MDALDEGEVSDESVGIEADDERRGLLAEEARWSARASSRRGRRPSSSPEAHGRPSPNPCPSTQTRSQQTVPRALRLDRRKLLVVPDV